MTVSSGVRDLGRAGGGARTLSADVAVFLAAFALRAVYLFQSASGPAFWIPTVDAGIYHEIAARWAEGRGMSGLFFWQPFFYPFFLGLLYKVVGVSVLSAKVANILLGSLTCVLTRRLGRRVFGSVAGWTAGMICVFYGPLVYYDGELLGASWAAFWALLLVLTLMRACERPRLATSFLWGMAAAVGVLIRTEFLLFALAGTLLLAFRRRATEPGEKIVLRSVSAALCGFLVITLPVATLCHRATGHFAFLPTSGPLNLYLGNHPDRCRTVTIRPGWEWRRLNALPLGQGAQDAWDSRSFYTRQLLSEASKEPRAFVGTIVTKLAQVVGAREIPRNSDIYLFREWSSLLGLLVWKIGRFGFPFGVIFPFAVLGFILHRRSLPAPLTLFLVCIPLAVVTAFVAGRYRVPLVPFLAVLAAGGALSLAKMFRERRRSAAAWAGALLLVSVAISLPGPYCEEQVDYEAELSLNVGIQRLIRGELAEARRLMEAALARRPDWAEARDHLGAVLYHQGRTEEGKRRMLEAIALNPEYEPAYDRLANALLAEDRDAEALGYARRALAINPDYAEAHNTLGVLLARTGNLAPAAAEFDRALELRTDYPEAHNNVGKLLARMGRAQDAAWHFTRALQLRPGFQEARENLEALPGGRP